VYTRKILVVSTHGGRAMHAQVNCYNIRCYKGFATKKEADEDHSKFIVQEKKHYRVGKGACQI
jgi:hypothetical protein